MSNTNIHHPALLVNPKILALLGLLDYALTHRYSQLWIGAIQAILAREGLANAR